MNDKQEVLQDIPLFIDSLKQIYTIGNGIPDDRAAMEIMEKVKGILPFILVFPDRAKSYIKDEKLKATLQTIRALSSKLLQGIEQKNIQTFRISYNTLHSLLSRWNILSKNDLTMSLKLEIYQ